MTERILTEEIIQAFHEYLILEEKSTATVEKYLRDVRAFRLFIIPIMFHVVSTANTNWELPLL